MKQKYVAVLVAAVLACAPLAMAGEGTTGTKEAAKLKVLNNKNCPISNHAAGSMQKGSFVDYKGYRLGLCCDGCKEEFNKNPDAYLEKAKKDAEANKPAPKK